MGLENYIFKKVPEGEHVYDDEGNMVECHDEVVIYWWKCNEVHGYFERLFGELENCADYPVTVDQLKELRDTCQKVLDNHNLAEELLPTYGGVFFGTYDYDERYFSRVAETVSKLDGLFENSGDDDEYYFYAWW